MIKPRLVKTLDENTNRNFQELARVFSGMFDGANAGPVISVSLSSGDNSISTGIKSPQGRIIVFQDAASTLFDKGMVNGKWVINASAPCNVKLTFF